MKNDLDIHQSLSVYAKIIKHGSATEKGKRLNGITAHSSFDGYIVILEDDKVSLTIHFHNKYDLEYSDRFALQEFMDKVIKIDKTKF
ncbi:MAG: DUF3081 family protein [Kangiellaceae bacterium]|jgi:hypothetical protein|nr:DUF3081 family protein [Kangiellaceae bacterium]